MSEDAVRCLVEKLETLFGKQDDLSRIVYGRAVARIRDDFESTSSLLRSEDNGGDKDRQKAWVKQVQGIAQRIQDSDNESVGDGFISFLDETGRFMDRLKEFYQLAATYQMQHGSSSNAASNPPGDPQLNDLRIEETVVFSDEKSLINNSDPASTVRNLLACYYDLPFYLKSCVLYFSLFPKDSPIKWSRLIRLWDAEGFIVSRAGRTFEEVADDYLTELINRNLVVVQLRKPWGTVVSCHLHHLLYEAVLLKSRSEKFSAYFDRQNKLPCDKIRRLSVHASDGIEVSEYESCSRLRSLLIFSGIELKPLLTVSSLLTVVEFHRVPIENFPLQITMLFQLKYLSLQGTLIRTLPDSVGKLTNLETLNLKGTSVRELPVEILKLHRLRNLLVSGISSGMGFHVHFNYANDNKLPSGIGRLASLQRLADIEVNGDCHMVRELGHLTQLKKLGILKLRTEDGKHLCTSIRKMHHLRSLTVRSVNENEVIDLHSLSPLRPLLQHLRLVGHLKTFPNWMASLGSLVRICLISSRLRRDPLKLLQSLPDLVSLTLEKAYDGEELRCEAGGYPKLKTLDLWFLNNLKNLKVEEGAMSSLQVLDIAGCEELVEVPSYLRSLPNLEISIRQP